MKNASAVIWAVALLCAASGACAQGYPPKPIRIVVGFPAGGGNDIIAQGRCHDAGEHAPGPGQL